MIGDASRSTRASPNRVAEERAHGHVAVGPLARHDELETGAKLLRRREQRAPRERPEGPRDPEAGALGNGHELPPVPEVDGRRWAWSDERVAEAELGTQLDRARSLRQNGVGASLDEEPVDQLGPHLPTESRRGLEQCHRDAVATELPGGDETGDAAADHEDAHAPACAGT